MSLYPENPAGQTFISQDTYASAGAALSGLGGGGGGQVPTNLTVSTLTAEALLSISSINGTDVSAFTGDIPANLQVSSLTVNGDNFGNITLGAYPANGASAILLFNTPGQETEDVGQLQLQKFDIPSLGPVSTLSGLIVASYSTVFGQLQPVMSKNIILGGDNNDGSTPGAEIDYSNSTSTISMYAPNVGISSLVGVSSINGVAYSTGGGVPADLAVSSLTVNGTGNITLNADPANPGRSTYLFFNSAGQDTVGAGQLSVEKADILSLGPVSTLSGLKVSAFSTFGQVQPLMSKSIILGGDNNDAGLPGAEIDYTNTTSTLSMYAPKVSVPALVNVSSINDTTFFAPRSGIFFMPPGSTTGYYDIPNPPAGITSNAVVMCTLTRPDGISQNWIVNSGVVQGGGAGTNWYIEVVMASSVVDDNTAVAWDLIAPTCTPGVAGTVPT